MKELSNYYIFSDESGQDGSNRYGALATVSGLKANMKSLNERLGLILNKYEKKEIKFKVIKNHKTKQIAKEFLQLGIDYLRRGDIKVHVLVWDKQDERHNIKNRDDLENLKRMYYKLLMIVKRHWNKDVCWHFYPDEFTAINWKEDVVKYLKNTYEKSKT